MIRPVALLGVLLFVAGCGISVVQSPTVVSGGAKKRVLAFAGSEGPMLLQVSGEPFGEGKSETAAASARILSGVYPEAPHGFTPRSEAAGIPQYRFRLAFDPPASTTSDQVCAESSSNPLSYDRREARQTLLHGVLPSGSSDSGCQGKIRPNDVAGRSGLPEPCFKRLLKCFRLVQMKMAILEFWSLVRRPGNQDEPFRGYFIAFQRVPPPPHLWLDRFARDPRPTLPLALKHWRRPAFR